MFALATMFDRVRGVSSTEAHTKRSVKIIFLVLTMAFSFWIKILPGNSAGEALLSFSPAQSSGTFPQSITVNVTLTNVVNLNAWEIEINFNPAVLAYAKTTIPSDNLLGPSSGWLNPNVIVQYNNTVGYVRGFLGLDGTAVVSGSGTLWQITFNVLQPGISAVTFADVGVRYGGTELFDANVNPIPFNALNGDAQVGASGFQYHTFTCIKDGVTYNAGLFTNSTVSGFSYNGTADVATFFFIGAVGTVGSCTCSIPIAMMNGTLVILVNGSATYFSRSEDSLNGYLIFSYEQGTVRVDVLTTVPGDLNGDRKVDMRDLAIVAKAFGSSPGNSRWNPIADVFGDGKVDMTDVAFVAKNFGRTFQPS
jgi:hypothetical protein